MLIRSERPEDASAIHDVVAKAFVGSSHGHNGEADLVDMIRADDDAVLSLVAEVGDVIVGHAMFSRMQTPAQCLGLGPVAVAPEHQRAGIGAALITSGLQRLESISHAAASWRVVFVLGEPEYYTRFGFSVEAASKFETEYPKDFFMARELCPGALSECDAGTATYARAFLSI